MEEDLIRAFKPCINASLCKYEAKSEKKAAELAQLLEQLKIVDAEIAEAQKDALRAEKNQVKKLRQELVVELDGFKDAALKIRDQTEDEVKAALKEEKRLKKEWDAKIAALMG